MASSVAINAATPINLKVKFVPTGANLRHKLPLGDLVAGLLETKLRDFLAIQPGVETTIERYSDSASTYVCLDPANLSVWKQLHRAAKAKQKLKLRVNVKAKMLPQETENSLKSAEIEDEVKAETAPHQPQLNLTGDEETSPPLERETPWPKAAALETSLQTIKQREGDIQRRLEILKKLQSSGLALRNKTITCNEGDKTCHAPEPAKPENGSETTDEVLIKPKRDEIPSVDGSPWCNFCVCCNKCGNNIPDAHYHCSSCEAGDFDLCQDCVDLGITCYGSQHWLIKRYIQQNEIINSHTERLAPKLKAPLACAEPPTAIERSSVEVMTESLTRAATQPEAGTLHSDLIQLSGPSHSVCGGDMTRICNGCVEELSKDVFVHCTTCDDFDLCEKCFARNKHGHHPTHAFAPAVEGAKFNAQVTARLAAGRGHRHCAICDGCDKYIVGVRHKCLDCPDWDYCSSCVQDAALIHAGHRFVPVFEALETTQSIRTRTSSRPTHMGICCDGPLCSDKRVIAFIVGDRYKCAVCHDTDFCASCEASPSNTHNRTHPLIKFKTPVRHVSVTTTGDQHNGQSLPTLGDRSRACETTNSKFSGTETQGPTIVSTNPHTFIDVLPTEAVAPVDKSVKAELEIKSLPAAAEDAPTEDLVAVFQHDAVPDGTVMPPNQVFQQTWVLRNDGNVAWPVGCSVKYTGGEYMGHVDSERPASIAELVSSCESTVCYGPLAPGQEFAFTVLLRSPSRAGNAISNWRLTTPSGIKFGHRLWCDITVQKPVLAQLVKMEKVESALLVKPETDGGKDAVIESSQMIFPKLEKESPVASVHEGFKAEPSSLDGEENFEDCVEDEDWAEDSSEDDDFLTDDEYDILDMSGEDFVMEQQKKFSKK